MRKTTSVKRRQGKLAVIIPWFRRFGLPLCILVAFLWLGSWLWMGGYVGAAASASSEEAVVLSGDAGFVIKNIMLENRTHTDPAILKAIINVQKGDPLFSFNPAKAKALIEKINWVRSAQVERRWPDTLYIRLEEREPGALWQHDKALFLVDKEGTVIAPVLLAAFPDLMIVLGDNAPLHVEELLNGLKLDPALLDKIISAKWIGDRRWDLNLKNNVTIKLPEADIKQALTLLAAMQAESNILDKDIIGLDLREAGRVTVQPVSGKIINYKNMVDKGMQTGNNI